MFPKPGRPAPLPLNFCLVGQTGSFSQRQGRYVPASLRHPGKMLPHLAHELIQEYTEPGDWILDPLSGIGTVGVEAIHLGRHYVGVELEPHWEELQRQNLALARRQGASGDGTVFQGDARRLAPNETIPAPELTAGAIDAVVTSPPYGGRLNSPGGPSRVMRRLIATGTFPASVMPHAYGTDLHNLGNLRAEAQLQELRQVYAGCYSVLKPGGLLVLVLQPEREHGLLVPLHHETTRLCQELGLEFLDERVALLARIHAVPGQVPKLFAHASFFQRLRISQLRAAGHRVSLGQLEYVLVFRKPRRDSPPVERTSRPHKNGLPAALAGPDGLRVNGENLIPGAVPSAHLHPTPHSPLVPIRCRP